MMFFVLYFGPRTSLFLSLSLSLFFSLLGARLVFTASLSLFFSPSLSFTLSLSLSLSLFSVAAGVALSLFFSLVERDAFSLVLDELGVFFLRRFRAPFFSQVVYALGSLVVPSESDVFPAVVVVV